MHHLDYPKEADMFGTDLEMKAKYETGKYICFVRIKDYGVWGEWEKCSDPDFSKHPAQEYRLEPKAHS